MTGLGVMVDVSVPRSEDYAAAAREWMAEVPGVVAPGEWREVLREAKPSFRGAPQAVWPEFEDYEEPFVTWGEVLVSPAKWRGMRTRTRRVTARNLSWLDSELAARPVFAAIRVFRVDCNGSILHGGAAMTVQAEAALTGDAREIPVGRLSAYDSLAWRPGAPPGDEEIGAAVAGLARRWAARPGVTALFAGPDVSGEGTALTYSLPPRPWWDVARAGCLAGYAWITLCPAELAVRVGGAAGLKATGAFWSVEEMPSGAVLLQLSEHPGGYGIDQAHAAFRALAPLLPAGVPERPANWDEDEPWLVVPHDAAADWGQ